MRMVTVVAAGLSLWSGLAIAQTNTIPQFEVATIKPSAPDSETFMQAHPGGRLSISSATLRTLVAFAWRLQPYQVSGGPSWIRSEYFSIETKASENPAEDRLLLMLRALLEDRFSLKLHSETKEQPVYILVSGTPGKTAPTGLQVTTQGSCAHPEAGGPPDPNACGSLGMGSNHIEAQEVTLSRLTEALTRVLERKVIDKTGLAQKFNVRLQWEQDEHGETPSGDSIKTPPDTPAIFTALQEQLGLKLKPAKAQVELLVIDHAERPGDN